MYDVLPDVHRSLHIPLTLEQVLFEMLSSRWLIIFIKADHDTRTQAGLVLVVRQQTSELSQTSNGSRHDFGGTELSGGALGLPGLGGKGSSFCLYATTSSMPSRYTICRPPTPVSSRGGSTSFGE